MLSSKVIKFGAFENSPYEEFPSLLSQAMGVSYKIIYNNDRILILPDGNWTGVIGMVNRSEVDVAVSNFIITDERLQAVSFSFPTEVDDYTFATNAAKISSDAFAIFHLMPSLIWLTLAVSILVVIFSLYVCFKRKVEISDVCFAVLATTLCQAITMKPKTLGQYQLMLSWIVGMAFFTMCYKSVLLSSLAIPTQARIRDISELATAVENGQYQCMTYETNPIPNILIKLSNKEKRIIADNILSNSRNIDTIETFLKNPDAKIAYIGLRKNLNAYSDRMIISEDSFFPTLIAFAARKDFCCKKQLDESILKITESGIYDKAKSYYSLPPVLQIKLSDSNKVNFPRKLSLTDVQSSFISLLFGYCIALAVFVIEIIVYKLRKMVHRKKNAPSNIKSRKRKTANFHDSPLRVDSDRPCNLISLRNAANSRVNRLIARRRISLHRSQQPDN